MRSSKLSKETELTSEAFPDEIHLESEEIYGESADVGQSYESNEHLDIGNLAFANFFKSLREDEEDIAALFSFLDPVPIENTYELYDPENGLASRRPLYTIKLTDELSLTPGDVIALAGDFFALADEPIAFGDGSDEQEKGLAQEERFRRSYAKLTHLSNDRVVSNDLESNIANCTEPSFTTDQIQNVLAHIRDDAEAVNPHSHWILKFKKVINDELDINNLEYGIAMASEKTLQGVWHSPYFKLAINNFDHFGKDAEVAFLAGHRVALESARQAGLETDKEKQTNLLRESLLQELFACHFLTDLFASGHMRTPRRALLNYLTVTNAKNVDEVVDGIDITKVIPAINDRNKISAFDLTAAAFFARKMHDEDGQRGVFVRFHGSDKRHLAFGDGNYYKPENQYNATKACKAVLVALNDLILAYKQEEASTKLDKNLDQYIPKIYEEDNKMGKEPLFYIENNAVLCRGNIWENSKEKTLLQATQEGLPCSHLNAAYMSHRFFKVKIKPTAQKIVGGMEEVANHVVHGVEQAVEATAEQLEELRQNIVAAQPQCTFL